MPCQTCACLTCCFTLGAVLIRFVYLFAVRAFGWLVGRAAGGQGWSPDPQRVGVLDRFQRSGSALLRYCNPRLSRGELSARC